MERVTLEWEFRRVGDVKLDSGRLKFPTVGSSPGIYRFTPATGLSPSHRF